MPSQVDPMRLAERVHDPVGTLVAVGFMVLGGFLIASTDGMTAMGSVFPITISLAMIAFCAVLVVRNVVRGLRGTAAPVEVSDEARPVGGSNLRRALFLAAMVGWIALLPILGFLTASAVGFFTVMAVATHERMGARELAVLVVVSGAILTGFYLVMANVLMIPMPRGVLL